MADSLSDRVAALEARFASVREKPAPKKAAEPATKKAAEPKKEPKRPQIPVMTMETAKQIHDRIQSRRYGSYREIMKSGAAFVTFSVLFVHGQFLFSIPFGMLASYYYSNYQTDHSKYRSWSKRVAVIPDISIFDDRPQERVPLQKFRELMTDIRLPTIID